MRIEKTRFVVLPQFVNWNRKLFTKFTIVLSRSTEDETLQWYNLRAYNFLLIYEAPLPSCIGTRNVLRISTLSPNCFIRPSPRNVVHATQLTRLLRLSSFSLLLASNVLYIMFVSHYVYLLLISLFMIIKLLYSLIINLPSLHLKILNTN